MSSKILCLAPEDKIQSIVVFKLLNKECVTIGLHDRHFTAMPKTIILTSIYARKIGIMSVHLINCLKQASLFLKK